MSDKKTGHLPALSVGDVVWHKWSDHHRGGRTLVKTVGRKWITVTDGGRFDPITGWGDDKTPGRFYASEAAYVEMVHTRAAWWDTMQQSHPNMGEKMTLDTIQQVRALLGLPAWEG